MYKQRLHALVYLCLAATSICLIRLAWLQIACRDSSRAQMIHEEVYRPISLPTVRGSIQDRQGRTLAFDDPAFYLHINYRLSRLLDDRFWVQSRDFFGRQVVVPVADNGDFVAEGAVFGGDIHRVALFLEALLQKSGGLPVVFDDEDAHAPVGPIWLRLRFRLGMGNR